MLTALESLPEDVLLDAEGTPPASPTYNMAPASEEQQQISQHSPQQPQLLKQQSKGATRKSSQRCIVS